MTRVVLLAALASVTSAGGNRSDHDLLQGRWRLVRARASDFDTREGFGKHVLSVRGTAMTAEHDSGGQREDGPFKIDPTAKPKRIDFKYRGKGEHDRPGIYELDGAKLRICFSSVVPARPELRPTDFDTPPGKGWVLLEYERVKE